MHDLRAKEGTTKKPYRTQKTNIKIKLLKKKSDINIKDFSYTSNKIFQKIIKVVRLNIGLTRAKFDIISKMFKDTGNYNWK